METKKICCADVLVVGGGLAAMYAAVHAAKAGQKVVLLSKKKAGLSGASLVSMSVHRFAPHAQALRDEYIRNFMASGKGINDPGLLKELVMEGGRQVEALREYGLPLHFKTMDFQGRPEAYLACCAPKSGRLLTCPMRQYIETKTGVTIMDGYMAVDLTVQDGQVKGLIAEKDQLLYTIEAKAVVLATGGAGYIYESTSNTSDLTGDGYAMAVRAGLELRDMEFVQFYPYRVYTPVQFDIFPDIFTYGARFLNEKGERFMEAYPKKEQENRDVLARCMFRQAEVALDLSGCDPVYLEKECPNIFEACHKFRDRRFLARPVAHFMMGGIPLKADCATGIRGLYCCGEVSGGLHGANRMAGSALTETAVFGPAAGIRAAEFAAGCKAVGSARDTFDYDVPEPGREDVTEVRQALRKMMWSTVSLMRTESALGEACREIERLEQRLLQTRPADLRRWFECRNMLVTAKCVADSAMLRNESRGAHAREDYPAEDPAWTGSIYSNGKSLRFVREEDR